MRSSTARSAHVLDDDMRRDAGLILCRSGEGLGLGELFDTHLDLGEAPAGQRRRRGHDLPLGLAGGEWIGDADALRAGATGQVLGHRVAAPSTLGTFLRSFTWGSTGSWTGRGIALAARGRRVQGRGRGR